MATIQASIKLTDMMTPALTSMNRALNLVISSFEHMQRTSSKAVDVSSLHAARKHLADAQVNINAIQKKIENNKKSQDRFNQSLRNGSSAASDLWGKIKNIATAYIGVQTLGGIIKTADELTMTTARLNLMNDGLQTTGKLQNQIYESAMRSRAGYLQTADAVAKLRLRAGQIFKTNEEAIVFSETLNKMFAIAGASQSEMYSATLQLTQALGSGVLRGEEFRAVFEAAPNVMQAVADYMDIPIGKLREISNEGMISAEIVKNAMFEATQKVDEQFKTIPKTWGQVWTLVKNYTLKATQPILERIRNITSSERFVGFMNGVGNAISIVAKQLELIIWLASEFAAVIYDNWGWIQYIVWGIVGALGAYYLVMLAIKIQTWLVTAAKWAYVAVLGVAWVACVLLQIAQWALAKAFMASKIAVLGLNKALIACPFMWVIIAVVAIIALFYWWINRVNELTGVTVSATGLIAGAFAWLGAFIANIFIGMANMVSAAVQFVVNCWNWCAENMGTVFHNIGVRWDNLWIDARVGFYSFINDVLAKLSSLATKIQPLADLLDIDLSGMIGKAQASINTKISNLESGRRKAKAYTSFQSIDLETFKYKNLDAAWDKGYNWGEKLENKVKNFGSDMFGGLEEIKNMTATPWSDLNANTGDKLNDLGKALGGGFDKIGRAHV